MDNRDWMSAQCDRICDYLHSIPDLPQEFLERRNLKAISMKQFLLIVNHLFRQIGGSRFKLGANYIEDIMKTMAELEYPFTISKSILKTPNVPHSINHIIVLIGWLIQRAPQPFSPQKRDTNLLPEFHSFEYQDFFFDKVQEGFSLWNLKKEQEFEAIVEELTDKLVVARTHGLNQQQVWEKIAELEQGIEEVENRTMQKNRDHSLDSMAKSLHEQQLLRKSLYHDVKCAKELESKVGDEYYTRQEDYYARVNKYEHLKQEIEAQQLSVEDRDEIISSIGANKNLLTARRLAVSVLEHTSYDHQIAVSRLIKRKFNLISDLNTKLHQFSDSLKPFIQFTAPELDLKTENYQDLQQQLHSIKAMLADVLARQASLSSHLNEEKSKLEHQLADLQIQHTSIEMSLREWSDRYEQLQRQRDTVVNEMVNSQSSHKHRETRANLEAEIVRVEEQCEQNRQAIEKLTHDKQKLMVENLERCQDVLRRKQLQVNTIKEQVEQAELVIANVERNIGRANE